jgi:WD40 repeat protein
MSRASQFYIVGGTLAADAPSYVKRGADEELYRLVRDREFCYVLTSRQMGKSSLMVRTAKRLADDDGCRVAMVDLTTLGTATGPEAIEQWYYGLAEAIRDELGLDLDLEAWWDLKSRLPAVQRLGHFFRDVVLTKTDGPVVIFVDEIDTTLGLPFSDDFFAAIRSCFNRRAANPEFFRLTFVFLGVASPSDLIADRKHTPFNIGHRIDLTDFTPEEARPLAAGLSDDGPTAERTLRHILEWTGGHPYLTQRACELVSAEPGGGRSDAAIDRVIEAAFLAPGADRNETNLRFVHDRLASTPRQARRLLPLYRKIRRGGTVRDDPRSRIKTDLKLSGVVKPRPDGVLRVRNRIYERVFTDRWAKQQMPSDITRSVATAAVTLLVLSPAFWYEVLYPQPLITNLMGILDDVPIARANYEALRRVPFYSGKAEQLWGEFWVRRARLAIELDDDRMAREAHDQLSRMPAFRAQGQGLFAEFQEQRAVRFEQSEKRDEALIWRLEALATEPTERRRCAVNLLVGSDYPGLDRTFREASPAIRETRSGVPWVLSHRSAVSADCSKLLIVGSDGAARIWDLASGQLLGSPMKYSSTIDSVAFSPDGAKVLTVGDDGVVRLWDAATGQSLGSPLKHGSTVSNGAFSPDGARVLTAGLDGVARLWDTATGQPLGSLMKHGSDVTSVAFSPDGAKVLTAGSDRRARLWDAATSQSVGLPFRHGSPISNVAFSPNGTKLLTAGFDGVARLWDTATSQSLSSPLQHGDLITSVAFSSPDGARVLTADEHGVARLWDVHTGKPLGPPLVHGDLITSVAFSPDGAKVLTVGDDGVMRLWDAATGQPLNSPLKHSGTITSVAFSPDGTKVLTAGSDGVARLWDTATGQPLGSPLKPGDIIYSVAFSPDGAKVLTAGSDGMARLWDAATSQSIGLPLKYGGGIYRVAFSPDGTKVLTAGESGMAQLWDAATGQRLGSPLKHVSIITSVAFSPDGVKVLTAGTGGVAWFWDTATGQPIGSLSKFGRDIYSVAFSPDGTKVLTAGEGGMARLWNAATGTPLGSTLTHGDSISSVAFSPDGRTALAASTRWVHRMRIDRDMLKPLASRMLPGAWVPHANVKFLDPSGDRIRVAVLPTGDTFQVVTINFKDPEADPIQGDPSRLRTEWRRKLMLTIDEDGKIIIPPR